MNSRTMRLAVGLGGLLATAGLGLGIVQGAFAQSDQPARQTASRRRPRRRSRWSRCSPS